MRLARASLLALPLLALLSGCASMLGNLDYAARGEVPPPFEGARMDAHALVGGDSLPFLGTVSFIDLIPSAALDAVIVPVTGPAWLIRGDPEPVHHGAVGVFPGPC